MPAKKNKKSQFAQGDVLFCTYYKVVVVLLERYEPSNKNLPITWNCHVLGEELRTYVVLESDLTET